MDTAKEETVRDLEFRPDLGCVITNNFIDYLVRIILKRAVRLSKPRVVWRRGSVGTAADCVGRRGILLKPRQIIPSVLKHTGLALSHLALALFSEKGQCCHYNGTKCRYV